MPRLRCSDNVRGSVQPPFRAGLTFLAVGPTGLEAQTASSKGISRTTLQNCRSPFDFAQGRLSAALRRKNIPRKGPRNCRSLGCARDDKGEGGAAIRV